MKKQIALKTLKKTPSKVAQKYSKKILTHSCQNYPNRRISVAYRPTVYRTRVVTALAYFDPTSYTLKLKLTVFSLILVFKKGRWRDCEVFEGFSRTCYLQSH